MLFFLPSGFALSLLFTTLSRCIPSPSVCPPANPRVPQPPPVPWLYAVPLYAHLCIAQPYASKKQGNRGEPSQHGELLNLCSAQPYARRKQGSRRVMAAWQAPQPLQCTALRPQKAWLSMGSPGVSSSMASIVFAPMATMVSVRMIMTMPLVVAVCYR
ncbi:hypothetical protein L7F22_062856 [Adiantum nelumboides]|nr:hypothetical protein [Adiantum nelumboides]